MEMERVREFDQQPEPISPMEVTFDWKLSPDYYGEVGYNAFFPEILMGLNLKTIMPYELLGNPISELPGEEVLFHTIKASSEWPSVENPIKAEEMPEPSQIFASPEEL